MVNRELVISSLIQYQEQVIQDFETLVARYKSAVDADDEDTQDIEDLSRQDVASEMMHSMELQLVQAQHELNTLKTMDMRVTETVTQGSIVATENYKFFIAIANHGFKVGDDEYIGLAPDAPIYSLMRGKKAGDSFSFNKKDYTIKAIY
ncbi:MAG: hypothetical protein ACI9O4_001854 [Chitinophagales bacterium]|jgi:hypothetical protein